MKEVSGSLQQKSTLENIKKPIELKYKLNVYNNSGLIKPSISVAVFYDMSKRHGDIMRSVSSTKWMSMDEICNAVWQIERKMKYPGNRGRKSIEAAVLDLVERSFVLTRT